MRQNEIIRINIEIDDRDLRRLQEAIVSLNDTLGNLNRSIGNVSDVLSDLQPNSGV